MSDPKSWLNFGHAFTPESMNKLSPLSKNIYGLDLSQIDPEGELGRADIDDDTEPKDG